MSQNNLNSSEELLTSSYDYQLPPNLIAKYPVYPRDSAKLLVYNRGSGEIIHTTFQELLNFLPEECSIFINDTKVIKARIFGKKVSGGKVELLFNKPLDALSHSVFIKGRVKVGTELIFDEGLIAHVKRLNSDGSRVVKFLQNGKYIRFEDLVLILDRVGHIPLPPYINREDNLKDEVDYQTIFAKHRGAVASPTASLHFTEELFQQLKAKYPIYQITLHIGAGTFKPVEVENILKHKMHSEHFLIPETSAEILRSSKPILAIGTTVTRTVEDFARTGRVQGECDLFLNPQNRPKRVNHLLTNFHLPKSTLIMLVASFIGRKKTLELYREAVDRKYRFFSYGDAMLIM